MQGRCGDDGVWQGIKARDGKRSAFQAKSQLTRSSSDPYLDNGVQEGIRCHCSTSRVAKGIQSHASSFGYLRYCFRSTGSLQRHNFRISITQSHLLNQSKTCVTESSKHFLSCGSSGLALTAKPCLPGLYTLCSISGKSRPAFSALP